MHRFFIGIWLSILLCVSTIRPTYPGMTPINPLGVAWFVVRSLLCCLCNRNQRQQPAVVLPAASVLTVGQLMGLTGGASDPVYFDESPEDSESDDSEPASIRTDDALDASE